MNMRRNRLASACAAALGALAPSVGGCAAGAPGAGGGTAASAAASEKKPDPRQGKKVSQLCFTRQLQGWRPQGTDGVILERSIRDEFFVTLTGGCRPDLAFTNLGFKTFGNSSCLSSGDRIATDEQGPPISCLVKDIYEWHEKTDAAKTAAASAPSGK